MSIVSLFLVAFALCLAQFVAALPWVAILDADTFRAQARRPSTWLKTLTGLGVAGIALALFLLYLQDRESLELGGRGWAALLQLQLLADLFVLVFAVLLLAWPRGGAVALAAFREGVRQPLFWLFAGVTFGLLFLFVFIPFFTFGEDVKMMKQIDYDLVMLAGVAFGVIAAGLSISEEIEGRTALTLLSKPVSRRDFLLGKYVGILLATLALTLLLGGGLQGAASYRPSLEWFPDDRDPLRHDALLAQIAPPLTGFATRLSPAGVAEGWLVGMALWTADALATLPGLAICFGQVLLLVAIACALSTRLPMVVTLVACLLIFFFGHLAPVLLQVTHNLQSEYARAHPGETGAALDLVRFVAQVFDTLLPALEYFNLGPALVRARPLPLGEYLWYAASVLAYALIYAAIALLVGLILFEDRDLA